MSSITLRQGSTEIRGLLVLVVAVVVASAVFGLVKGCRTNAEPELPKPTAADAANISLTDTGVTLIVKQRDFAWLPGGISRLHLDDITGRQVLVSVTDAAGHVVCVPRSLQSGDVFTVDGPTPMSIECVRLKNLLTGTDFGEFRIRSVTSTTRPVR
ncbi:MAG TPA: hypothetical protein VF595_12095 [Tepidisphaeraceae bacterium]